MPGKPPFNPVGIPQYLGQRADNREPCFYAEEDCRRYFDELHASAVKHAFRIRAHVLMTNHVHWLVTPMAERGMSQMMQALRRRHV